LVVWADNCLADAYLFLARQLSAWVWRCFVDCFDLDRVSVVRCCSQLAEALLEALRLCATQLGDWPVQGDLPV
jgi:hypothetical protein